MTPLLTNQNFLSAVLHASIGHIVARAAWVNEDTHPSTSKLLMLAHRYNVEDTNSPPCFWWWRPPGRAFVREDGSRLNPPKLLGNNKDFDIQPEDIIATDWEVYRHV